MASTEDKGSLTIRLLQTPAGQEVFNTFITTMVNTWNIQESVERARQLAEKNGTLLPFEIFAIIDLLKTIGPLLINLIKNRSANSNP